MSKKIANAGVHVYCPEMGEKKPLAEIEATRAIFSNHYLLDTPLELKGRGITFIKIYEEGDLVKGKLSHKFGWKHYKVTANAFNKLKETCAIRIENWLD